MAGVAQQSCHVEYRGCDIVISGPSREAHAQAQRIIRRFACSAVPYRLASTGIDQVILKPA